jgi:tRNA threonylcarbamoyladenosine biosynthesis protein TsaB
VSEFVLAIDTALSGCSVAIVRGDEILVSRIEPMARGQAERLAPLVDQLMAESGVSFGDIKMTAVTTGPGAFTGLRVGLAFARGLALALDKPCIGLSTLEVLAAGSGHPKVLAVIAVAGSVFVGAWAERKEVIAPCRVEDLSRLLETLDGTWVVTGPGAGDILTLRPDWPHFVQSLPDPAILAALARQADPVTHMPNPLYLRGVEAKLAGGKALPESAT